MRVSAWGLDTNVCGGQETVVAKATVRIEAESEIATDRYPSSHECSSKHAVQLATETTLTIP